MDGNYFAFSPLQFGLICSDLAAFPLRQGDGGFILRPRPARCDHVRNYATIGFRKRNG